MLIQEHTVALEARLDALEINHARLARQHDDLQRLVFALLQCLVANVPMTAPDGQRVTVVTRAVEGEPA